MEYKDLLSAMRRFGAQDAQIRACVLEVPPEKVCENVIITPGWEPDRMPSLGGAELLNPSGGLNSIKAWNIENASVELTYIKAGFGAHVLMDAVLALGLSDCRKILFVSSIGSLDREIGIGDLIIPEFSICGDGASRYIASDASERDVFGEKSNPDNLSFERLKTAAARICEENHAKWHIGRAFCTDTIFA